MVSARRRRRSPSPHALEPEHVLRVVLVVVIERVAFGIGGARSEASVSVDNFDALPDEKQQDLLNFLRSL